MTHKKIKYSLFIIGTIVLLIAPDMIVNILITIVHFFFTLILHFAEVTFEGLESLLDRIVEYFFDTEVHETQTIVFYLMILIALFPLYFLCRIMPGFFIWLKEILITTWTRHKNNVIIYWQDLSPHDKIKMTILPILAAYLIFSLFF
jgi:flagellar biosynthesis protein FlhB